MTKLFAVTRSRGPAWNDSLPLEGQEDWDAHAVFMNALHKEGFVLLGGPLAGTRDVLLIVRAHDAEQIEARLAADCWTEKNLLVIKAIHLWTLRLGSLA
jgi:hypothetical protein